MVTSTVTWNQTEDHPLLKASNKAADELTLLVRGEGATVALILQLLPEFHYVLPLYKALTAKNTHNTCYNVVSLTVEWLKKKKMFCKAHTHTHLRRGLTMLCSSVFWMWASRESVDLNNMESSTEEQENKLEAQKQTDNHERNMLYTDVIVISWTSWNVPHIIQQLVLTYLP